MKGQKYRLEGMMLKRTVLSRYNLEVILKLKRWANSGARVSWEEPKWKRIQQKEIKWKNFRKFMRPGKEKMIQKKDYEGPINAYKLIIHNTIKIWYEITYERVHHASSNLIISLRTFKMINLK